ncbi:MAG: ATP-binding protein, partial [Pirellulaceae bacterium]|nr:ATP-binding protein [Pirellulaceae bacterium]
AKALCEVYPLHRLLRRSDNITPLVAIFQHTSNFGSNNDENLYLPFWLLNRAEMLAILLDRSDQNAPNQSSRFSHHVQALKQESLEQLNKRDVLETFTVDSPIPYSLTDLVSRLKGDDTEMVPVARANTEKKGEWNGKLTRFVARLETKIADRRYGFMFSPPEQSTEYEWLARLMQTILGSDNEQQGIKIIDFSEVPSDVLPVVVAVFSRLLYDVQFWMNPEERTPITIVCDEAHLYLPVAENTDAVERQAVNAFERIAKEGKKYGASLLVVSQRPSDVSRTILSQCNNFLILRLTNDRDQGVVRRLLPERMVGMVEIMPLLDTGEALLIGDSILLPTRIRLDKPELKPASATRNFWTDWANCQPSQDGIAKAVETLRKQSRE